MNKKNIVGIALVLLLLAAGGVFWAVSYNTKKTADNSQQLPAEEAVAPEQKSESLGAEAYEQANNPLKGAAIEANPFKEAQNPFTDTYTNPFE